MSAHATDPGGADAAKFDYATRALPLEGAVLRYVDEGEGDPVLMLHGNPTWGFFYRRMIEALRGSHRAIAPDHVGCGRSDKPAHYAYTLRQHAANLETLIDHLNLRDITLVVHDWGGAIGFAVAVRRPELFRRFVVLNTAAFFGRVPLRIRMCRPPLLGEALVRGLNGFSRAALTMAVVHRERMTPQVRAGYLEPYRTYADRRAVLAFVRDIPTSPAQDSFHVIREIETGLSRLVGRPMLICWGGRDFCFNDAFLQEWRRRFPRAVVHRFDDAGHYILEDAHERIFPLVQAFLRNEA
ncbi:MAG: alpha/beta fold hydrolase [Phycisphaerae bacterium]|nr:MAG: alpha/beta fold hydrolase [Planctomycetota bacterium]KAB2949074.1 MAG: alpha/beta fold hydrolase [Phycisphaerae bacterium]MBE7457105.1 alpha/beta fold hydrolase [Planctomycetia bacterium]MCK6463536.1 alpha/beta fold hydrolase [Phycisphaerae bacterium]MCL4719018.1 alpha/beta fold hydrolase [Phycisphaerae bacterium]